MSIQILSERVKYYNIYIGIFTLTRYLNRGVFDVFFENIFMFEFKQTIHQRRHSVKCKCLVKYYQRFHDQTTFTYNVSFDFGV